MIRERRLGQGLDVLLGDGDPDPIPLAPVQAPALSALPAPASERPGGPYREIPVDRVDPNPYQPRTEFDEAGLAELADSIARQGLFQPIIVRSREGRYELVAGERRWRAFQRLGRSVVPALVRDVPDEKMLLAALLENLQRRDLNPIEKGRAFRALLEKSPRTQDEVAADLGIDRSTLANFIRLLDLPEEIQGAVSRGTLSMGHARALLSAPSSQKRAQVFRLILTDHLPVRAVERMLSPDASGRSRSRRKPAAAPRPPWMDDLESRLRQRLGTQVKLNHDEATGHGEIVVRYFGREQLEGLLDSLGVHGES